MTLYQFRLLDEMEQTEALWDAVHLMDRIEGEFQYELYQRDGFYIELKRHREQGVLHGIRPFKSTTPLDAYLNSNPAPSFSIHSTEPVQEGDALLEEFLKAKEKMRRIERYGYALVILLVLVMIVVVAYCLYRLNAGRL